MRTRNERGREPDEQIAAPPRHGDSRDPTGQGQQETLGEKLPHHAGASGAEGGTGQHLARSHGQARQHQVRQVEARCGEHQADHPEQHPQRTADGPADDVVQRLETNADTAWGILFLRFDAGADDAQLGKRRRQRLHRAQAGRQRPNARGGAHQ